MRVPTFLMLVRRAAAAAAALLILVACEHGGAAVRAQENGDVVLRGHPRIVEPRVSDAMHMELMEFEGRGLLHSCHRKTCAPSCAVCRFPRNGVNRNWGHCKKRGKLFNCRRNWDRSRLVKNATHYEDWDRTVVDYDHPLEFDATIIRFEKSDLELYSSGPEHDFPPKGDDKGLKDMGHGHVKDHAHAKEMGTSDIDEDAADIDEDASGGAGGSVYATFDGQASSSTTTHMSRSNTENGQTVYRRVKVENTLEIGKPSNREPQLEKRHGLEISKLRRRFPEDD